MNTYNENGIVFNLDTDEVVARYFPNQKAVINYKLQRAFVANSYKEAKEILMQWVA